MARTYVEDKAGMCADVRTSNARANAKVSPRLRQRLQGAIWEQNTLGLKRFSPIRC